MQQWGGVVEVQEGIVFIWQRLKAITASLSIWILFQGWSVLCAYVATHPPDWSHMMTNYNQFYRDLSKQPPLSDRL